MTDAGLKMRVQFYTSRGFAVLDVNYSGSTGYGRAYRERLDGAWGIADVADCAAGARHLAKAGLADGSRIAIAGGSAGGYTTLMALATTAGVRRRQQPLRRVRPGPAARAYAQVRVRAICTA